MKLSLFIVCHVCLYVPILSLSHLSLTVPAGPLLKWIISLSSFYLLSVSFSFSRAFWHPSHQNSQKRLSIKNTLTAEIFVKSSSSGHEVKNVLIRHVTWTGWAPPSRLTRSDSSNCEILYKIMRIMKEKTPAVRDQVIIMRTKCQM